MVLLAALLLAFETPQFEGTPADVNRKAASAYKLDADTSVVATFSGAGNWVLEVCGAAKQAATITFIRDATTQAKASVTLGAIKKPNCTGVVAFAVASGVHKYVVSSDAAVDVIFTPTPRLLKSRLLGAEQALPKVATAPSDPPASMPARERRAGPASRE